MTVVIKGLLEELNNIEKNGDKCYLELNKNKLSSGEELTIRSVISPLTRANSENQVIIRHKNAPICWLTYKEYPYCCGKVMIYGISCSIPIIEQIKDYERLFYILFKFAFEACRIKVYSFADYVISVQEQPLLYAAVIKNETLYNQRISFSNVRTKNNCENFIKMLT